jgi:hypothetical protein
MLGISHAVLHSRQTKYRVGSVFTQELVRGISYCFVLVLVVQKDTKASSPS